MTTTRQILELDIWSILSSRNTGNGLVLLGLWYKADLARQRERHLTATHAVQIPKYGQIKMESRPLHALSRRHVTFLSVC